MRISFEHQFKKWCGDHANYLLVWNDEYEMYSNHDTNLAFIWYCRGYHQGEKG
jgi:hypothetical protein